MKLRRRLEEDGVYVSNPEHWEMWETKIHTQYKKSKHPYSQINVPVDIVRHLNLQNKDKVVVAIKRK